VLHFGKDRKILIDFVDVFPYFEDKVNKPIPANLKPLKEVTKTQVFEDEDLDVVYLDDEEDEVEEEETDDQE